MPIYRIIADTHKSNGTQRRSPQQTPQRPSHGTSHGTSQPTSQPTSQWASRRADWLRLLALGVVFCVIAASMVAYRDVRYQSDGRSRTSLRDPRHVCMESLLSDRPHISTRCRNYLDYH